MSRTKRENGRSYRWSPGLGEWVEVKEPTDKSKPTSSAKRQRETAFTQVMLNPAAIAFKVTRSQAAFVWVWLQYEVWRTKSAVVTITNAALTPYGITRWTKYRALQAYAKAGLINILRDGKRAIVVEVLACK
jgi:hypothetical protein